MNLGTETNLQSQSHNRGQTTLGLDYASLSPKQMACGFSYWDKMSILQITLWKLKFQEVTAKPTALHCLDCTSYQYCNYYMLLFMLTPLGFHNNILLRFNCVRKKGKPLKQFFVWEVPLPQLWKVLPEYDEQFSMRGVPIRLDRTARTYWILFLQDFDCSWNWILTKYNI